MQPERTRPKEGWVRKDPCVSCLLSEFSWIPLDYIHVLRAEVSMQNSSVNFISKNCLLLRFPWAGSVQSSVSLGVVVLKLLVVLLVEFFWFESGVWKGTGRADAVPAHSTPCSFIRFQCKMSQWPQNTGPGPLKNREYWTSELRMCFPFMAGRLQGWSSPPEPARAHCSWFSVKW